eukprot:TRINITY_DN102363_c0_g1_i1.p1 TRINITY_DN102363_c0_g1~~TRINITY_DN102363_c0_g1_i1.p1  ORF type:complete len:242 (+),score=33.43 TRINITY_DN102363_c0_g1_i1:56-781(+)
MGEKAALTRLSREYVIIQQSAKIPHIVARPSESNMLIWHFVIHDLPPETPYRGGAYAGKLVFPKEYPLKPPAIYMLTPSGRFEVNSRLCLSMSDFHPESWNPSWRIESILVGLVSFMLDPSEPRTTGGMHTSVAKRKQYAKAAFAFNKLRAEFVELFPEFCEESRLNEEGLFSLSGEVPAAVGPAGEVSQVSGDPGQAAVDQDRLENQAAPAPFRMNLPRVLLAISVLVLIASFLGTRTRS